MITRLANRLLNNLSYRLGLKVSLGKYPDRLKIEPTNVCDLRCKICSTGRGRLVRPGGFIDVGLVERIVGQVGLFASRVDLWHNGEPFLHSAMLEIIRVSKAAGLYTVVTSNGRFYGRRFSMSELVDSGLDCLRISLDGATQPTLDELRPGADLEHIVQGIQALEEAKRIRQMVHPSIHIQFVVTRQNETEIPMMKSLARRLGVRLRIKTVGFGDVLTEEHLKRLIPPSPEYSRYQKLDDGNMKLIGLRTRACTSVWHEMVVNWNGNVTPCCDDLNEQYVCGNLHSQSVKQVWNGKYYQSIREQQRKHRSLMPMCNDCSQHLASRGRDRRYISPSIRP